MTPEQIEEMRADMAERVGRAWASIDGRADRFDACKASGQLDRTDGSYSGYLAEAHELLKRSGIAAEVLRLTEERAALAEELARVRSALQALVNLNDTYSPFGGEIYRDRIDHTWENARAALSHTGMTGATK